MGGNRGIKYIYKQGVEVRKRAEVSPFAGRKKQEPQAVTIMAAVRSRSLKCLLIRKNQKTRDNSVTMYHSVRANFMAMGLMQALCPVQGRAQHMV